ncbi:MAG TPA: hypothetical protein VH280_02970 [Verrucomicrobiae bacterium]|nr:hypothetical protein [Verrucomicrobiae bacterium]
MLTIAGSAKAALTMSGSLGVIDFPGGGSFTSSSLILSPSTVISSTTGTFQSLVPLFSSLASYTGTLTGLSSTPKTEDIDNFFVFPASSDRFEFNLGALSETGYNANSQSASYIGTGTLVDTLGIYAVSPATFALSFSAQGNYSFVLSTPIPEPNQYGIFSGVFAFLLASFGLLRRRKFARL